MGSTVSAEVFLLSGFPKASQRRPELNGLWLSDRYDPDLYKHSQSNGKWIIKKSVRSGPAHRGKPTFLTSWGVYERNPLPPHWVEQTLPAPDGQTVYLNKDPVKRLQHPRRRDVYQNDRPSPDTLHFVEPWHKHSLYNTEEEAKAETLLSKNGMLWCTPAENTECRKAKRNGVIP